MVTKESLLKLSVIISLTFLLVGSIVVLVNGWYHGYFDSVASLQDYLASFGVWAPLILTIIQALQVILPVLPGFMGCLVGPALFGEAGGFFSNYIGISVGSIIAFLLAKKYGRPLVETMMKMEKYDSLIERINKSKSYTTFLFLAVLLPLFPDDFLCYFSGLINMSAKRFVIIIILAKPWYILFYTFFAAYFI